MLHVRWLKYYTVFCIKFFYSIIRESSAFPLTLHVDLCTTISMLTHCVSTHISTLTVNNNGEWYDAIYILMYIPMDHNVHVHATPLNVMYRKSCIEFY